MYYSLIKEGTSCVVYNDIILDNFICRRGRSQQRWLINHHLWAYNCYQLCLFILVTVMSSFPNLSPNSWHWLYLDMSKDCWQLAFSYFFLVVVIFFSFNGISCSHNACSLIVLDQNLFFEAN